MASDNLVSYLSISEIPLANLVSFNFFSNTASLISLVLVKLKCPIAN